MVDHSFHRKHAVQISNKNQIQDKLLILISVTFALLAVTAWSYWPVIGELVDDWQGSDDYSAGQLVPLVVIFLVWRERKKLRGYLLKPATMDRINGWAEMLRRLGDPDRNIPPTWKVFRRCTGLIETLPMLEHNPNNPEEVLKMDVDEDGNGGDDYADGARYGIMEAEGGGRIVTAQVDLKHPKQPQTQRPVHARSEDEVQQLLEEIQNEQQEIDF